MVEKISRSEQKRLFKQVEGLAKELIELSESDVKKLPADESLKDDIRDCRGLKGGARKRQAKYLAKVLRQGPLHEIYEFLTLKKGSALMENQLFHRAERWRDVLVNEGLEVYDECRKNQIEFEPDYTSALIGDLLEELSRIDENDLRRCVFQYARTRNRTHYREIFRMLKAAIELEQRTTR